jgi:hypothetical protein
MPTILQEMMKPSMHSLDDPSFVVEDGTVFEIKPDAHRQNNLGRKVLIIDVDSRLDLDTGAILNPDPPVKETMKGRTAGILNHLMYALVHGYDYRLIRAPQFTDRHGTWVKVPAMRKALEKHDFVIFLDSDAIFENVALPVEWLMGLWNITDDTILAIAKDPWVPNNSDAKGKVMWNTGFMIGQKSERTNEFFSRWEDCPTGQRYKECTKWAYSWAHEQAALANHVRYDYVENEDVRVINCNEGNGLPGPRGGPNCNGVFIRHFWYGKNSTITELYNVLPEESVVDLHRHFHDRLSDFYLDASSHTYPLGSDVVI